MNLRVVQMMVVELERQIMTLLKNLIYNKNKMVKIKILLVIIVT